MKGFIVGNWITILIILAAIGYITYLVIHKKWEKIRADAYKLMLNAEFLIKGTKRGQERFDYVFLKVYSLLPLWVQFIYPPGNLKKKLQEWFDIAKDKLDDNIINNSVKSQ